MNATRALALTVAAASIVVLSGCAGSSDSGADTSSGAVGASAAPAAEASQEPAVPSETFTMAEVAAHATPDDCWAAVRGGVYDLTAWIEQHPGGPAYIIELCGTDGTALFEGMHSGSRSPESILQGLQIGTLK